MVVEPGALAAEPVKKLAIPSEEIFSELNDSPDILVIMDEAYSSVRPSTRTETQTPGPGKGRPGFCRAALLAPSPPNEDQVLGPVPAQVGSQPGG